MTFIGDGAFLDCTSLTSVTVENENPIEINAFNQSDIYNVFYNVPISDATLYVPIGCKAAYETADYWKNFGTIVEDVDITFADANVKALCVQNWDTNHDGELSRAEAGAVTDLGEVFKGNTEITSFNELQYFTGLTAIADEAFEGCRNLESVQLPEGLTRIGGCWDGGAFRQSGLKSIKFPSTVTEVGNAAFQECVNLTSIDFNGCTATLEGDVFSWCGSLEEVYIPKTITLTGYFTFACCASLKTVIFEEGNPTEDIYSTFTGAYVGSHLETVILPSTAIMGEGFFGDCSNLKSVTFLSGEPGEKHFANNFQAVPNDVLFTIPDGTAEAFLKKGYRNLSDKGALPLVKEEFEAEATRIMEMAEALSDGDKVALSAAVNDARSTVNSAEDYLTVYAQIATIKDAAKTFLTTATMPEDFDVTAATITNPDNDRFDIGWNIGLLGEHNGWQQAEYSDVDQSMGNFMEGWKPDNTLNNGQISQTITNLPAGFYRLECDAIATWKGDANVEVTGVSLFAGDAQTAVATANNMPQHFSVEFANLTTGDVEIGIRAHETNANWMAADNFRLYYIDAVGDVSQLDNAIYIEPISARIGGDVEIAIKLKNTQTATAYKFDLVLPEGVTIATGSNGKPIDALSDRHSDHSRTLNEKGDNTYSFATLSGNSEALTGNDGAIRLVTLHVADDMAEGSYPIKIRNASYSLTNGKLQSLESTTTSITVESYLLGDVNGNNGVDIGDAVTIVNYLVGKPTTTFVEKAADTNKNNQVDIGDAVTIVNYLVGKTANLSRKMIDGEKEPQ